MQFSDSMSKQLYETGSVIDVLEASDDINTEDKGFLAEYHTKLSTTGNQTTMKDDDKFIYVLQKYFMKNGGAK